MIRKRLFRRGRQCFLKTAIAPSFCSGWRGRAEMWEKPKQLQSLVARISNLGYEVQITPIPPARKLVSC